MRLWVCCFVVSLEANFSFIAFGDWGENRADFQSVVAQLHRESRPEFVALLGDNFYPKGLKSVSDPQLELFDEFSGISNKFFVILGNHDYGYAESCAAHIEYGQINSKWLMPSNYYSKIYSIGDNGVQLCMLFLDTHVFEPDQLAWMHEVLQNNCQYENMFRLVFAHYPLYTAGIYKDSSSVVRLRSKIASLLVKYHVHAYVSGHEHQMQAIEVEGVHFLVSGAVAQMNRRKSFDNSGMKKELKFFDDESPGFLRFRFLDNKDLRKVRLSYDFVSAKGGKVKYTNALQLTVATTTTTTTRKPPPTSTTSGSKGTTCSTASDHVQTPQSEGEPKSTDVNVGETTKASSSSSPLWVKWVVSAAALIYVCS